MYVGSGKNIYEWIDNWAMIPDTESARTGWAHIGIVVTESGDIITGHQDDPVILVFDKDGHLKDSWESGVTETHGITLVKESEIEYLWIADNGRRRHRSTGYEYPDNGNVIGMAIKKTLDGQTSKELMQPDLPIYKYGDYMPTSIAVNEERHGGNGDIWVSDGYGQNWIHQYNVDGDYISSINGEEGNTGLFNCPHGIFIDRRKAESELYIADRTNGRVQVYDLAGTYKRTFGSNFLTTPSAFATHGDFLIIAELRARITILDRDDNFVCYLGDNEQVCDTEGWPNIKNKRGKITRTNLLKLGRFNSPHGVAVDKDGNLYIAEWLIGGRITKLNKR